MQALPEQSDVTPGDLVAIRAAAEPVVMRGLVRDWPVVAAERDGALLAYLTELATDAPVPMVRAAPAENGVLHYDSDLRGPNFTREPATLRDFLSALGDATETLVIQGLNTAEALPGFAVANPMPVLPSAITPRVWIGGAAKVATHNDPSENIACVVAGRRRFTLFPPEQIGNLYMGPFHLTPAGTPVSMAHVTAPDFDRFPRFAEALAAALTAELGPGDAIYIPYGWYHHVEARDRINMLVNYWWDPARADVGSPWDALMHGMMTLRNLPPDQRRAWQAMFDHYVFLANGDPGEHLPDHARGILGATTPRDVAQMRAGLIATLQRAAGKA